MLLFAAAADQRQLHAERQAPRDLRTREATPGTVLDEYDRERGPILVGDQAVAASVAHRGRPLKLPAQYTEGALYAPHRLLLLRLRHTAVEREEGPVLAGTDDRLFVRRLGDLLTGREPQGGAVSLTLDPPRSRRPPTPRGPEGAVVALDPTHRRDPGDGSSPSFDPNVLSTHDAAAIRAAYDQLNADPASRCSTGPSRQTYPPGSMFKLVTLAAALSSGQLHARPARSPARRVLDLPQTTSDLPNSDGRQCTAGSDETTLTTALERSCNTTFGALGMALGEDALREQADAFGFDAELDVPMRVAESVFPTDLDPPQTAQSAIGQFDVRATPLGMAHGRRRRSPTTARS